MHNKVVNGTDVERRCCSDLRARVCAYPKCENWSMRSSREKCVRECEKGEKSDECVKCEKCMRALLCLHACAWLAFVVVYIEAPFEERGRSFGCLVTHRYSRMRTCAQHVRA